MLFTTPLALFGLLALPALVVVYWLRRRYRPLVVSSLLLWREPHRPQEGGTRFARLQTPLLFFVELLILSLLTLAAAGPRLPLARSGRPLAVVLDDSFSMRAGGSDSSRARAAAFLADELRRRTPSSLVLILAGERPRTLAELTSGDDMAEKLRGWTCRAPTARLDEAAAFAAELAGPEGRVLVLTDHPPPTPQEGGRVEWCAFGKRRPNLAVVAAARTVAEDGARCLLEIANLSDQPRTAKLTIETADASALIRRLTLNLGPNNSVPQVIPLPPGTPAVRARLDPDDLEFDNEAILLPATSRPVRVRLRIDDAALRGLIERGLRAARDAALADDQPDLILTDRDEDAADVWVVRLDASGRGEAFDGPFIVDRAHPLADGLPLHGVVWGASRVERPGRPIVLAGDVPLLTDQENEDGKHRIQLALTPALSTLQDSPAWPVLLWNLIHWRAAHLPGAERANLRLGEDAVVNFAAPLSHAEIIAPDGSTRTAPLAGRRLVLHPDDVGVWRVCGGEEEHRVAVHPAARDESNLSACATGRWGEAADEGLFRLETRDAGWPVLLLALALMLIHLCLVARGRRTTT
jgi:hypothetical protein